MKYIGAAEWFFYEGILKGFTGSVKDLPGLLKDKFVFKNQVTKDCTNAFIWGFCFGLILTYEEYINLTSYKKDVTLVTKVMEDQINGIVTEPVINDEDLANVDISGVC